MAQQPINYMLNLPNPREQLLGSLAITKQADDLRATRAANEAATAQNRQLQTDLGLLYENPTPANVAKMMTRYPQLTEQFKRTYDVLDAEQQKSKVSQASEVYAALSAGENDIAATRLREQSEAARNSGMEKEAKTLEDLAKLVELSPETAKTSTGLFLASAMGPDKFTETFTKLEGNRRAADLETSNLTKAQSEAYQAAVAADFADSTAALDLQKKGWEINTLANDVDIKKENTRIAAMNAQLKREQNQLKREEMQLKLDEAKRKRDEKVAERAAEVQASWQGIDNSLSTIDRLLGNPELDNVIGSMEGGSFYPSVIIGTLNPFADGDKRADALADVENVQSQQFLDNLMQAKQRGATFGSLTQQEGAKLENYVRSLKRRQSEGQFRQNLREIQRLLLKSRSQLADKYGVPESIPDTPGAQPTPDEIDAIMNQYLTEG